MSGQSLASWMARQRWFAAPAGASTGDDDAHAVQPTIERWALPTVPPLSIGLATTPTGDRYQLLLHDAVAAAADTAARSADPAPHVAATTEAAPASAVPAPPASAPTDPVADPDRGQDPATLDALARFVACNAASAPAADGGAVVGRWLDGDERVGDGTTRLLGVEQSNTSAVIGGTHVLKVFRRVHAGPHPELEIGRHLAAVSDTAAAPVPALCGWYELAPGVRTDATGDDDDEDDTVLGVVQRLVPGAADGWALVLSGLSADPDRTIGRLHDLGATIARLHDALALPATASPVDPEAPEAFGATPLGAARVDAVAEAVAADAARTLPRLSAAGPDEAGATGSLAGEVGAVAGLAAALADAIGSDAGAAIRHHGDLHLGQTVVGPDGWQILDFEGEPNRPLAERRLRHSPLRDVAGMLRSFAYAAATHRRSTGRLLGVGWEPAARAAFLDGYLAAVRPDLLPGSPLATMRLLELFELEKVVYEVGYELAHRPSWVHLPVAGLTAMLEDTPR